MAEDTITITILEDGTIKAETDQISGPNHMNADQFLQWMANQAGGQKTRQRRGQHTHHEHEQHHEKVKS